MVTITLLRIRFTSVFYALSGVVTMLRFCIRLTVRFFIRKIYKGKTDSDGGSAYKRALKSVHYSTL